MAFGRGWNDPMKKKKGNRSVCERNLQRQENERQDEYGLDRYCYGEDESF